MPEPTSLAPMSGAWTIAGDEATVDGTGTYAAALGGRITRPTLLGADITFEPGTRACGLLLAAEDDPEQAYVLRLEPHNHRLVFDRWPRRRPGPAQWQIGGEIAHVVELERHIDLDPGRPHRLEAIVDGTALIAYLDGQIALSTRIYGRATRRYGWFMSEGAGTFSAIAVRSLPEGAPSTVSTSGDTQ
jgi:beta-fructofuranosidase